MLGADQVEGDWLTAWSLLDLFLLLVFSLAVFRLFGATAGITALIAFGLAYHEPGAPRLTWLFLLMPIALLRVVNTGTAKRWISTWKYFAILLLLLCLVPFVAMQTQNAIYPQLETTGMAYGTRGLFVWPGIAFTSRARESASFAARSSMRQSAHSGSTENAKPALSKYDASNLLYDPKSRIQTGPAQPQWEWNDVDCYLERAGHCRATDQADFDFAPSAPHPDCDSVGVADAACRDPARCRQDSHSIVQTRGSARRRCC